MTDTIEQASAAEPSPGTPEVHEETTDFTGLLVLVGLIIALGWFASWTWAFVVVAIIFMIFMHELGHYLTAKWSGMKVTEFFIGFGPRLWSFRRGETEYGVKAIPAGAYVRIIGMNNLDDVEPGDEDRAYRVKSFPRQLAVAVAGSAMHFIMAIALLFVVLTAYGVGDDEEAWEIGTVSVQSAAEAMGLEPGDEVLTVDGIEITTFEQFGEVVGTRGGSEVGVVYERDGEVVTTSAVLGERLTREGAAGIVGLVERDRILQVDDIDVASYAEFADYAGDRIGDELTVVVDDGGPQLLEGVVVRELADPAVATVGFFGVSGELVPRTLGPVDALSRSVTGFVEFTGQAITGLGRFFTPGSLSDFFTESFNFSADDGEDTGAVVTTQTREVESRELDSSNPDENRILSIYGAAKAGVFLSGDGFDRILLFLAGLNIFIGVFNLAPFPPLDGGHVVVAVYERIRSIGRRRRYHVDYAKVLPITYAVFMILVTIGMIALFRDIFDPVDLG